MPEDRGLQLSHLKRQQGDLVIWNCLIDSNQTDVTAQFLPGILDANLCKNKQTNN